MDAAVDLRPLPTIDWKAYPDIWDALWAEVETSVPEVLLVLRDTCRELRERVDALLAEHVVFVLQPRRILSARMGISLPLAGNLELLERLRVLDMRKGRGGAGVPVPLIGPEIAFPNVRTARVFDRESEAVLGRTIDRLQLNPEVPVLVRQITAPSEMNMDQFRYAAFGPTTGRRHVIPVPCDLGLLAVDTLYLHGEDEVVIVFCPRLDYAMRRHDPRAGRGDYDYPRLMQEVVGYLVPEGEQTVTIVDMPAEGRAYFQDLFTDAAQEEMEYRQGDGDDSNSLDTVRDALRIVTRSGWRNQVGDEDFQLATEMPDLFEYHGP